MSVSYWVKCSWVYCCIFHYLKLSSILIAETTFSSPDNFIILTPCVFPPAILISFTNVLMTLPLFVEIKISSPSKTGNDEETFPFLDELTIPIIPLPPLFVTLYS